MAAKTAGKGARKPSRASEPTRRALIEAATGVFAEHGFEGASVRLIIAKAKANQAAINYHFGGKEGLYREVLRAAVAAFEEHSLLTEDSLDRLGTEEALRAILRQLLAPLARRDRLSRQIRIFQWESVRPSAVFQELMTAERPPVFAAAERLVRRLLPPDAAPERIALTTFWLVQQPISFVRAAEQMTRAPFGLALGEASADALADFLGALIGKALSPAMPPASGGPAAA